MAICEAQISPKLILRKIEWQKRILNFHTVQFDLPLTSIFQDQPSSLAKNSPTKSFGPLLGVTSSSRIRRNTEHSDDSNDAAKENISQSSMTGTRCTVEVPLFCKSCDIKKRS